MLRLGAAPCLTCTAGGLRHKELLWEKLLVLLGDLSKFEVFAKYCYSDEVSAEIPK